MNGTIAQLKDLLTTIRKSDITKVHFNDGYFMQNPFTKKLKESTIEISITNDQYRNTDIKERNVTLFMREADKNSVKGTIVFDNTGWVLSASSADKLAVNELMFRIEDLTGTQMPDLFYKYIEGK